jgi:phage tail protein X
MFIRTHQGDSTDLLCQRYYGRTAGVTEQVLEANPGLAEYGAVLPIGLRVEMPDRPAPVITARVQLWD